MIRPRTKYILLEVLLAISVAAVAFSCSPKVRSLRKSTPAASIAITHAHEIKDSVPQTHDSIIVRSVDGKDMLVMKAVKDENGEMVASQTLEAATIVARFQNVAERHGAVDISFMITVPKELMAGKWQLRYTPKMFILGDSTALDMVKITGKEYRKKQLRGYQHYQRFIDSIITDSTLFIRKEALEIFLKRNIPELYAFKNDSSFVSEEEFLSGFGVSKEEAVDHYTKKLAIKLNERKKSLIGKKRRQYIKVPIDSDGVRLDSVIIGDNGDWTYQYVQTVATRPGLKKIEIVLDGAIFEQEVQLCKMLRSEPLCYYVSSVSSLVDESPRFVTRIIERKAEASMSYSLSFRSGKWVLDESLGDNESIMKEIRANCMALSDDKVFQLDSVCVCAGASPEGSSESNRMLSTRRSQELSRSIKKIFKEKQAADAAQEGFSISLDESFKAAGKQSDNDVKITSAFIGEDWQMLDKLVGSDENMTENQKKEYFSLAMTGPEDAREKAMKVKKWYGYVKDNLYPKLRRVNFVFHMHRRAMIKDTIHTTVLDTLYMTGVECIKNRDYARAIEILRPYNDYNTAVAYCAKDFNHSAMAILSPMKESAAVNYMLALLHSRMGDEAKAVELYLRCCSQDRKFIFRGNLDPEISYLIKKYNINSNN